MIDVYRAARSFNQNHVHRFENVFVHAWEADLFSVTKTGYIYEVEVKKSRSDFFADFKKPKHHFFKTAIRGHAILKIGHWHLWSGDEKIESYTIEAKQFNGHTAPNKFFYAAPEGLITSDEIPDYAGLIACKNVYPFFRIVKQAPYLHKDKCNVKNLLFNKYYWGYLNMKKEVHDLKIKIENMKKETQPA